MTMDAPDSATEIYVTDPSFANLKRLTNTNPQLAEVAQGETEVVTWKSSDGVEVEGVLLKPVGFQSGKRYPTLVVAHGGPAGAYRQRLPARRPRRRTGVGRQGLGGVLSEPARQLELRTEDAGGQRQRLGRRRLQGHHDRRRCAGGARHRRSRQARAHRLELRRLHDGVGDHADHAASRRRWSARASPTCGACMAPTTSRAC